tara:strand:- start:1031 stop:1246 length:216 start_codon:yes stop_codon:yes gene_type:complete
MKTVYVVAAGWASGNRSMGTLVNEGIMTKTYQRGWSHEDMDIVWHLKTDAGVIVDNGKEVMYPGDTVVWES